MPTLARSELLREAGVSQSMILLLIAQVIIAVAVLPTHFGLLLLAIHSALMLLSRFLAHREGRHAVDPAGDRKRR